MHVYRLHIRPGGGRGDSALSFAYCLKQEVLGVGWAVPVPSGKTLAWEEYERLATRTHGGLHEISRVRYLHDNVMPDDLIWTRDTSGKYYLAKVCPARGRSHSDLAWEYLDTPEGRDADIVNIVRSRIVPIPQADDATGKVVACFRPTRVIQSIADETTVFYSQLLWNQMVGAEEYKLAEFKKCDVFSFLDAETTEDVVFIYLQDEGWVVVPNSRKADTMGYEFVAINKKSHERAVVQVKTGDAPLETCWGDFHEKVFLFQTHENYTGTATPNVIKLAPKTIEEFMTSNIEIMPRAVKRWVEFVAKLNSVS